MAPSSCAATDLKEPADSAAVIPSGGGEFLNSLLHRTQDLPLSCVYWVGKSDTFTKHAIRAMTAQRRCSRRPAGRKRSSPAQAG
jgi:hypothetical protein